MKKQKEHSKTCCWIGRELEKCEALLQEDLRYNERVAILTYQGSLKE